MRAAIDDNTRALFCESIANPGGYVSDLPALAAIADAAGIPLVVDNTSATPYLCRPIEHWRNARHPLDHQVSDGERHGHWRGIVDSGKFNWSNGKFPSLADPEPAYHGLKFHEVLGPMPTPSMASRWPARPWHDDESPGGALHADGDRNAVLADGAARRKRAESGCLLEGRPPCGRCHLCRSAVVALG